MLNSDIAFCAGFFDADGCVSIKKYGGCLGFYNDNKEILENIRDALSVDNNILPREKPKGGISYTLNICKREHVIRVSELFLSCSIGVVKREKLVALLCFYPELDDKRASQREKRIADMQKKAQMKAKQLRKKRQLIEKELAEEYERRCSYIVKHPELPAREIASRLGISHVTIVKIRERLGLKQYRSRGLSESNKQYIIEYPETSARALAKVLGFSHVTISRFRKNCRAKLA